MLPFQEHRLQDFKGTTKWVQEQEDLFFFKEISKIRTFSFQWLWEFVRLIIKSFWTVIVDLHPWFLLLHLQNLMFWSLFESLGFEYVYPKLSWTEILPRVFWQYITARKYERIAISFLSNKYISLICTLVNDLGLFHFFKPNVKSLFESI